MSMTGDDLTLRATLEDDLSQPLEQGPRRSIERTTRSLRELAAAGVDSRLGRFTSWVDRSRTSIRRADQALAGWSRSLGQFAQRTIRNVTMGLGAMTAAVGFWGIRAASEFQQADIAFTGFLGSVEKGQALFRDLREMNKRTPFELRDLVAGARQLLGFQFGEDQLRPILKAATDISAGLGGGQETLQRILLNLGQVQATGKVTGRELRDFAVLGFPGYALVADILGKTREEVQAMGDDAQVSADDFIAAFTRMQGPLQIFGGMAEKQMGSLAGMWSNLKDVVTERLADAANPFTASLTEFMPNLIGALGATIDTAGPPIFAFLGTVFDLAAKGLPIVGPFLEALFGGLERIALAAGPGLGALEPLAGDIGRALTDVVDELVPLMPDLVDSFVQLVGVLPDVIRILGGLVRIGVPVVDLATDLLEFGPLRGIFAGLLTTLLGYRALRGVVGAISAFNTVLWGTAAAQEAVAASNALVGFGGNPGRITRAGRLGRFARGAGIATGVVATAAQTPSVINGQSWGADLGFVGTTTATGALIGNAIPIPGVGAGLGALAGGAVGVGAVAGRRFKEWLGDPPSHALAQANRGLPGRRAVTSHIRGWGIHPGSGHHPSRGTAFDVVGDNLGGLEAAVRSRGGYATREGRHSHIDTAGMIGDPAPMGGGGGGRQLVINTGGAPLMVIERVSGIDDLERAAIDALARALPKAQRKQDERARHRRAGSR